MGARAVGAVERIRTRERPKRFLRDLSLNRADACRDEAKGRSVLEAGDEMVSVRRRDGWC